MSYRNFLAFAKSWRWRFAKFSFLIGLASAKLELLNFFDVSKRPTLEISTFSARGTAVTHSTEEMAKSKSPEKSSVKKEKKEKRSENDGVHKTRKEKHSKSKLIDVSEVRNDALLPLATQANLLQGRCQSSNRKRQCPGNRCESGFWHAVGSSSSCLCTIRKPYGGRES